MVAGGYSAYEEEIVIVVFITQYSIRYTQYEYA